MQCQDIIKPWQNIRPEHKHNTFINILIFHVLGVFRTNEKNLWWSCLRKQLNETQIFKPSGHQTSFGRPTDVYMKSGLRIDVHWTSKRRLMHNGRHIKLNHRNIALLLQEATQKYWKHRFLNKMLLSLCALFSTYCGFASFAYLNVRVFSVLGRRTPQNYVEFYTLQVIICAVYSFVYSIDSLWNSYVIW